jgi:hypothetical protein
MAAGGALMARADGGISMSVLQRYEWPGNARALGNVMERAAIVNVGSAACRKRRISLCFYSRTRLSRAYGGLTGLAVALQYGTFDTPPVR